MDKRLQALFTREQELKEDEQNILKVLKMVREEMHKMQVEQLQWESMDMPVVETHGTEESAESIQQNQPLNESEVNAQAVNLEVPKLNELFMHRNQKLHLDEEEEDSEEADEPDTENEISDDDIFSMF